MAVWLDDELRAKLRRFCTIAELQLMLCGVAEIDVDDWQNSTKYDGGYSAESDQIKWFWAEVRRMTPEDRGKLLHFCTGSARAPATAHGLCEPDGLPRPAAALHHSARHLRGGAAARGVHVLQHAEATSVRDCSGLGREAEARLLG